VNTDSVILIIIAIFAVMALVLTLVRSFMDELGRTIEAGRKLRDAWRGDGSE
jgi:hypothetical protein